jgi:chloramphenicol-sensitive protein RarD
MSSARLSGRGLTAGAVAFVIWGFFPLYLHALKQVPPLQVIAHRIGWSCLFLLVWMLLRGEIGRLAATLSRPALWSRLLLSACLITVNWLVYVWSVANGHVIDSSLGYFINPLVNVVLGVVVLRERLRPLQWLAVALAACGVLYLGVLAGRPPWIALTLALSFSLYGLVRKMIAVEAMPGLATETLILMPVAVAYLLWCESAGNGAFGHDGVAIGLLLAGCGLVTAVPLFLFAYSARLLPYSTVGLLQYIGPSLQLACGVFFFNESFPPSRALGFALIWAALILYAGEGMWRARAAAVRAAAPA